VQPTETPTSPADASGLDLNALLSQMGATNAEALKGWPAGLPKEVPEFKYGTLAPEVSFKMEISGITAYAISYTGVKQANIDAYNKTLKKNGFTTSKSTSNGITAYTGIYKEKDGSMTMVVMMQITPEVFMVEVMPNVKNPS
jgi:hypothetical protein